MANRQTWFGSITGATSTTLSITDGFRTSIYGGSFSYSGNNVFGTLTSVSEYQGTSILYSANGLNISAQEVQNLTDNNQLQAVFSLGLTGNDFINGSFGNDVIFGYSGNDSISGNGGNDTIDGGTGNTTSVYRGFSSQYSINVSKGKFTTVIDLVSNRDGFDTLTRVKYLQFLDKTITVRDPIGIAIADQLSVVYLGRGVSASWRDATSDLVADGASPDMLKAFFSAAIVDRAFSASDSIQTIVNKTFLNIFGVNATFFEQNAWANTVNIGATTKEELPWAMFNSYLGANNVPDNYKIPAQSRIIAANAFTNLATGASETSVGNLGSTNAEAARAWLLPIRNQSDAASKAASASNFMNSVTRSNGSVEQVEDFFYNSSSPLIGVSSDFDITTLNLSYDR